MLGTLAIGAAALAGCPVFPADNHWNLRVDRLPVLPSSDAIVRSIGAGEHMHADFGSGRYEGAPIGIPYVSVRRGQPRVPVSFDYADESDRGRYPIPRRAPIEGGRASDGDRHVIVVQRSRCRAYELFDAHPIEGGAAGTPAPAPSSTCARTACARAAGHPRTRRGCRSCPASPATRRCGAGASTTRCASPRRGRGARSSTPPGTSPRPSRTPTCPPWASACA